MRRAILGAMLVSCAGWLAAAQSPDDAPKFEAADVHVSARTPNAYVRTPAPHGGRYEIKMATMVDFIHIAYGYDADKVLGGPNWLEMDRFDLTAKMPQETTLEKQKLMLQALLADRFKLVVHKEDRPLPTYALIAGKKPQLKPSEGTEETGCKPEASSGASSEGAVMRIGTVLNGVATTLSLGPGMMLHYVCRNMTMEAFVGGLRSMFGASVGSNPLRDETGLKGAWNFDFSYSLNIVGLNTGSTGEKITIFDAVEKQLGLKLDPRQMPTPVIVVDSVNRTPGANPPDTASLLPPIPVPTEFEVASVKPTDSTARGGRFQVQPGGRVNFEGLPLQFLISRAFNVNNSDQIVGLPGWANTERYDINAKAASAGPSAPALDNDAVAPMLLALLVDRFKLTYHKEDRPMPAFSLVSVKPKLKKADPASRTSCKYGDVPPGMPPGTRILKCQNVTMDQFADRLQNAAPAIPGLNWPVLNATELEGNWDITLSFTTSLPIATAVRLGGDAAPGAAAAPAASDPTGGYTLLEALEKQLGLKLELQKRPVPVFVIDHIERPTEN